MIMRIIDLALNAAIILGATIVLAYVGYHYWDFGLFVTLPEPISGFFVRNGALQYVALGLVIAALIAKVPVGRELKRRDAEKRI